LNILHLIFDYYLKSSELGYDYASYCVGWYYRYGKGVAQNSKKAFEYFSKTADSNIYSKFELAELYLNGEGTTKDPAKAIKLHLELAQNSHTDSYRSLGDIYFYGKGVSVNYSTAETYYKKAIDNNAPNMNKGAVYRNIGYCYEQLKKPYEAFKYMKMAAENNHADAMNRLGIFYEIGTGTSKNIREAMKWYEKSGDGGISYGYYNLALVYHYAKDGISYDAQKAKTYYTKAKNLGNSDAADQLKKL
jgi:TPR repeat protein